MALTKAVKQLSVIRHCFGCSPTDISPNIIISRNDRLTEYEQFLTNVDKFSGVWKGISGDYDGKRITVIVSGKTSSNVGDCIVALKGTSCESLFVEGTFGALNGDIQIGDLVVLKNAFIGEGFSKYFGKETGYVAPKGKMSKKSLSLMLGDCGGMTVKVHDKVTSYTIDSFLAEDEKFLTSLKRKGFDVIDMESSAVFTAANHIGAKSSFIGWCTDKPLDENFYSNKQESYSLVKESIHSSIPKMMLNLVVNND